MVWTSPETTSAFAGADAPAEEDLYKCVHCGFCLQACPTYIQTGLETESPRGRIAMMKAVNEGRFGITPTVIGHWDLCIQCRACEVACPSGVPYGRLIEAAMAQVERRRDLGLMARAVSKLLLRGVLPHQGRLRLLVSGLRLYQRSGAQALVRKTRLLRVLSQSLAELEGSAPRLSGPYFKADGRVIPPRRREAGASRAALRLRDALGSTAPRWRRRRGC